MFGARMEFNIANKGLASSFDVLTHFRAPRFCAQKSVKAFKTIQYYLSQNEMEVYLSKIIEDGSFIALMQDNIQYQPQWLLDSGERAHGKIGRFDPHDSGGKIFIET
jgi:hypothetical protein